MFSFGMIRFISMILIRTEEINRRKILELSYDGCKSFKWAGSKINHNVSAPPPCPTKI